MKILGVDFTSAPRAGKPITVAVGKPSGQRLRISEVRSLRDFAAFEDLLASPGPWIAGFDFPFGLSRQAVADLGWPAVWVHLLEHCRQLGRAEFKRVLDAYRQSRPPGERYAGRRGDKASGAHPSVKLVNPPVGYMFLEGAPRLSAAGLHVPGVREGDRSRVALEAYPGLLVRKQLGIRDSYKSDDRRKHTPARREVRRQVVSALKAGKPLGISLELPKKLERELVDDGSGDLLDAVICAIQAGWGLLRHAQNYGLPADLDSLEGWIVTS